jgi:hypothetical protein
MNVIALNDENRRISIIQLCRESMAEESPFVFEVAQIVSHATIVGFGGDVMNHRHCSWLMILGSYAVTSASLASYHVQMTGQWHSMVGLRVWRTGL